MNTTLKFLLKKHFIVKKRFKSQDKQEIREKTAFYT